MNSTGSRAGFPVLARYEGDWSVETNDQSVDRTSSNFRSYDNAQVGAIHSPVLGLPIPGVIDNHHTPSYSHTVAVRSSAAQPMVVSRVELGVRAEALPNLSLPEIGFRARRAIAELGRARGDLAR